MLKRLAPVLAATLLLTNVPASFAAPIVFKQDTTFKRDVTIDGDLTITGTLTPAIAASRDFPVDLQADVRNDDGTTLAATPAAGKFGITNGTHSAPGLKLTGETANNNTKTDYACMLLTLPPEYVNAGNVTVSVTVDLEGSGTAGTNTIDVTAFEVAADGTAGADICATAAQNLAASPTARSFTLTGTNLVKGDKVLVYFTMVLAESASTNLNGAITNVKVSFVAQG